jgi:hypothetical protein
VHSLGGTRGCPQAFSVMSVERARYERVQHSSGSSSIARATRIADCSSSSSPAQVTSWSGVRLPQHADKHRPKDPIFLAVDEELGEGTALWVAPELSDPVGALEVREHQDVEQLGAGSGTARPSPGRLRPFLLEEKQRYVEEALVRSEQAAWEERQLTMVLDPVPVRVDARMRPDR